MEQTLLDLFQKVRATPDALGLPIEVKTLTGTVRIDSIEIHDNSILLVPSDTLRLDTPPRH